MEEKVAVVTEPKSVENVVPVIVDAGSQSKASIRRLKKGTGRLMREVSDVVHEVRSSPTTPTNGLVPVVIVYRQKRRKNSRMRIPSPFELFRR